MAPLWSLYMLPPKPHNAIHHTLQHVVAPPLSTPRSLWQSLPFPQSTTWKVVGITLHDVEEEEEVTMVSPLSLLQPVDVSSTPRSFGFGAHHFQLYRDSVYAKAMSYPQFCVMERNVARIVFSYLGDTHHHWVLLLDPLFLYSDSIRPYGNANAISQTLWITPSIDIGVPDAILWSLPERSPFTV